MRKICVKRRLYRVGIICIILIWALSGCASKKNLNAVNVVFNGEKLSSAGAQMINGHVMLPLDFVVQNLGLSVENEAAGKTVTVKEGDTVLKFYSNGKTQKNGKTLELDAREVIDDNRVLLPAAALCQNFDAAISWDASSKTVTIEKKTEPVERALPRTGVLLRYDQDDASSPLTIQASEGVHTFIKIEDWWSGQTVLTALIRSGETIDFKVPEGTYKLKYATGQTWYGEKYLFGPDTQYARANKMFFCYLGYGYEIQLIEQAGGNMSTSKLDKKNF